MIGVRTVSVLMVAGALGAVAPAAWAQSIQELLPQVEKTYDKVVAADARVEAARNRARETLGSWFPTLTLEGTGGVEHNQRPSMSDPTYQAWQMDAVLTQLLWDFGGSNGRIEAQRLLLEGARAEAQSSRLTLMQDAVSAYVTLMRAERILDYARQSEENIRRQTGLEQARVDRGSGLSTDVLQAKTQLAGAEARRVQAEGSVQIARNRFKAVFGFVPDDTASLVALKGPKDGVLPDSLDNALAIALDKSPVLKVQEATAAAQQAMTGSVRGERLFPRVDLVAANSLKHNVDSLKGEKMETSVKVRATWTINLGLTAFNSLRAAEAEAQSAGHTEADTRITVEERVRNAWQRLETSRANARILANQANIAGEFLDLARRERQLGQRSLIDLLSGETALFNAQADAYAASADVIIASFALMANMGELDLSQIE
ncbi:TolC family protein [Pararhodospirillum oryzae]|uniref:Channel protein TolC n=1 Tax=Pararhodospirillum oryzae TaxID=478448 RepID=A0A512H3D8_9PROT|nr:TolC family protein [Pararhodospirillum oryzae]GEO79967.1 channel protein TolC [Pararhodospirillum oryzae]